MPENFSETFLKPIDGAVRSPYGTPPVTAPRPSSTAEDIAAVAAATLAKPPTPTPARKLRTDRPRRRLTVRAQAAGVIAGVIGAGRRSHNDTDRDGWIEGTVAGRRTRRVR